MKVLRNSVKVWKDATSEHIKELRLQDNCINYLKLKI